MNDFGLDLRFYFLVVTLTERLRTGYTPKYWNVQTEKVEDIGQHCFKVAILAINLNKKFRLPVNLERVVLMIVLHEIGEVLLGDITPFDNITPEQKKTMEHKAMHMMLEGLDDADELYALLLEFDEHKTNDAMFAFFCDKLQACIQVKWYQDKGLLKLSDEHEDSVVYASPKVQKILEDGAKTVFDVWYVCDRILFKDDPLFTGIMDWLKVNDTTYTEKDSIFTEYKCWLDIFTATNK
ncbi:MAG: HD domain-containing protein [Clostridia bacterium]|nr:HD domain-containing protein [Clostridia bacterium]